MVMRLKMSNTKVLKPLWLALGLSLVITTPYAANFYTIIGPDGHPMIVQRPVDAPKEISKKQTSKIEEPKKETSRSSDTQVKSIESAPVIQNKQVIDQQSKAQPILKNKVTETQTNTQISVSQQQKPEPKQNSEQQKEQPQKTNVVDQIITQQEDKQTQKSSIALVEKNTTHSSC